LLVAYSEHKTVQNIGKTVFLCAETIIDSDGFVLWLPLSIIFIVSC